MRIKIKNSMRNVQPHILAQIEDGVSALQYLKEGKYIMQEVLTMIDNCKQGNYNNYIGGN
jgi:hypothetical protein